MRDATDYLDELDERIVQLGSFVASGDERRTWSTLVEALTWVFRAEQAVRKQHANYYERRSEHRHGGVLAGLIYFRGEVDHSGQEEPYKLDWVKTSVWTRAENEQWTPAQVLTRTHGSEWAEATLHVRGAVFPELHAGATPDPKYKRDALYRDHVQGESITVALGSAAALLREILESG